MVITSNTTTVTVISSGEPLVSSTCCEKYCSFNINKFRFVNSLWGCTSDPCGNTMTCPDGSSICKMIKYVDNTAGWEWNNPSSIGGWKYPNGLLGIPGNDIFKYKIGDIINCTTSCTRYYYQQPTGSFVNLAYDVYFYPAATSTWGQINLNFMIWFDSNLSATPPGTYVDTINDGYNAYKVYRRIGRYPGESPPIGWYCFIVQGAKKDTYDCNMKYLIDFMKTMPATISGTKMGLNDNDWFKTLFLGTEFVNGTGKIRIARWNVNVNTDLYNIP